jgi:hypothetical protein
MPGNARTPTSGLVGAASRANSLADAQRHAVSCLGIRGACAPPLACAETVTGCHPSRAASRAWCFVRTLDSPTPTAAGTAETRTGLWAQLAGPDCARVSWRAKTQAASCSAPHSSPLLPPVSKSSHGLHERPGTQITGAATALPRAVWLALAVGSAVLSSAASLQPSRDPAALAALARACVRCAIGDSSRDTPSSLAVRLRGGMDADRQAFILKSSLYSEFYIVSFT